jgi:molybdopterin molybdotransferase
MISFEEALSLVRLNIEPTGNETVTLADCQGRVLAADVFSDTDMPPFDKAAVDGYACRREDLADGVVLPVVEVISAGIVPQKEIFKGCCSKIMTGAMIPAGADCVVMVEQTEAGNEALVRIADARTKDNIARKAEDVCCGQRVLQAGTLIQPQHLAVLASVGATKVDVYKRVKLCVFSTGDELVEPNQLLSAGKIRNSNAVQLMAQANRIMAQVSYGGIIADNEHETKTKINEALRSNQVLILSGGISMGDFDFVPRILEELGLKILFRTIAVQPGKPTVFARSENTYVFALPGNPVSSFNIFELLTKPFLYRLMGHEFQAPVLRLPLAVTYARKARQRMGFVPSLINTNGEVEPISYHGSAHIHALTFAQALMQVPLGTETIVKGELVDVRLI